MAIPDERKVALSIPTQTAMKGLRDAPRNSPYRTATNATFSKLISLVFEISGLPRKNPTSPDERVCAHSGGASLFCEPRRMIAWHILRSAQTNRPYTPPSTPPDQHNVV